MLTYVEAVERKNKIIIDGYTTNKTEKGIIKDVARAVRKYSESEANTLLDFLKFGIDKNNTPFIKATDSCGEYFLNMRKFHVLQNIMKKQMELNTKTVIIITS